MIWAETRMGAEAARLMTSGVWRGAGVPDGDGQPVLLVPGFLAGDGSLALMAQWLRRTGHRPHGSRITTNIACSQQTVRRLERRVMYKGIDLSKMGTPDPPHTWTTVERLKRLSKIQGSVLVVFGERDPHVPLEGRDAIAKALAPLGARASIRHCAAEHAFMRDEGPRWDPAAALDVWMQAIDLFERVLKR